MLLALNLPLIGLWVKLLKIPYAYLFPFIFLFCLLGTYSLRSTVFDIGVMILFGIVGYLMRKFAYEPAPFILAFILGPLFEEHFRRSLIMSYGSFSVFFERPISLVFIALAILLIISSLVPGIEEEKNFLPRGKEYNRSTAESAKALTCLKLKSEKNIKKLKKYISRKGKEEREMRGFWKGVVIVIGTACSPPRPLMQGPRRSSPKKPLPFFLAGRRGAQGTCSCGGWRSKCKRI